MELKNAINILFTKFDINYRILLYLFVTIAIVLGISISIIIPSFSVVFESPETLGMFTDLRQGLGEFLTGASNFKDFSAEVSLFIDGIMDMLGESNATVTFWVTFSVMCLLIRFVCAVCYPTIVDIINNFMSSNMKYGFTSNMLKNAKINVKYAFFHTLFSMAADIIIVASALGITKLFLPIFKFFALAVGLICAVILISVRLTFSSGIIPEMIVNGETSYFKAFKKSWQYVKKQFRQIFGAYCITIFCGYCLMALLTIITFGVAFFVLGAVIITFIHILQLVFFYGGNNKRYYVDAYTIVNTAPIEDRLDLQEELINHDNN